MSIKKSIKKNIKSFLAKHPKYEERVYGLFDVRTKDIEKAEVVIYFFGGMGQTYQIKQWIDTFKELDGQEKIKSIVDKFRDILTSFASLYL
jgi:hypothetical protein